MALAKHVASAFSPVWSLKATRTSPIITRVSTDRLTSLVQIGGPTYAVKCHEAETPRPITVGVVGKLGDESLAFDVRVGSETFRKCLADELQRYVTGALGTARGGDKVASFRVDASVAIEVTFDFSPPR